MKTKILKTIEAGPMRELVIYTPPTRHDTQQQRAQRSKVTSKAQADTNRKNRVKRLERYIWANFESSDRFITLTYSDEHQPSRRKTARAQLSAALRNIRAAYKLAGYELKYIYTTEDRHGDGRIHHHIIANTIPGDVEILRSLWPFGSVDVETMAKYGPAWAQDRAIYMLKEKKPNGEQGFTCSKAMTQPVIKTEWIDEDCALTAPRGAVILEEGKEVTEWAEYYHLKYLRPPAQQKHPHQATAAAGAGILPGRRSSERPGQRQPVNCARRV